VLEKMISYSRQTVSKILPKQKYLNQRKALVDWLSGVGDSLHISN